MAFFHLRSPAGSAWPPLPAGPLAQVWTAYQELDRTQWLKPAELEVMQFRQLRAMLIHCQLQVPYYRQSMADAGLNIGPVVTWADLRRLPLLSRHLYHMHAADLRARNLPTGMKVTNTRGTSGSNGVPIKVQMTDRVNLWWYALYLRDLEWSGFDPRRRLAALRFLRESGTDMIGGMDGLAFPSWEPTLAPLVEMGKSYGMDIRQEPRQQLAWLRKIDPEYLLSMPSNLEFLAGLVAESGRKLPSLQAIQAIGETLADDTRARIEAGFGVPVKNCYSATEAGYIASPCPASHGLHVHAENVLIEVLNDKNEPCQPGESGRLVLTTLHNFLMPFLRYDILDEVTLAPGPCPCGRGLSLLTRVSGRRHPLMFLPDGRRKIVTGMYLDVKAVGGLHQLQLIQRATDHIILRVVPAQSWSDDHATRMRQIVHKEFGAPIRVDVDTLERLDAPAGGKLKRTIIELEERNSG